MSWTVPLHRRALLLAAGLAAGLAGCRPAPGPSSAEPAVERRSGDISVLSYFLDDYLLLDRSGSGQANDPKPLSERQAVTDLICRIAPDILTVQDMGNPAVFEQFRADLSAAGCVFPYAEYVPAPETDRQIALLSRHPIRSRQSRIREVYRIGNREWPVLRGFLDVDIELPGGARLRVLSAHLKSKDFHPAGQTEMRRNEARLFAARIRNILREDPSVRLLVAAALNDSPDSAPVREIAEGLTDLRPADAGGDAWTWHNRAQDAWFRSEYLMVSPGLLADTVREKTRAVRDPAATMGSSHRPLVAVFRIPESAGHPEEN